jgi:MSHA pilin protein MshD
MSIKNVSQKSSGFTLIELVISIVILSIGVTAFLVLINQTVSRSADPMILEQANAIAQSYLEEVMLNSFCDPNLDCDTVCISNACTACTVPEGSRDLFDDVCDYNGLNNNGARDQNNNPIPGLGNFNITINVLDSGINLEGLNSDNGEVVRIDVRVTHDSFQALDLTLSGFKANY